MASQNHEALLLPVRAALQAEGARFGLRGRVRVRYVLNQGGFVNANFSAEDGRNRVHVKVAPAADQPALKRWLGLADELTARYRAPDVLGWLEVPGTGRAGLVFRHVAGRFMTREQGRAVMPQLAHKLASLHTDRKLFRKLTDVPHGELGFALMIREGVDLARSARPPFVRKTDLPWLEREREKTMKEIRRAQQDFRPAAIYGDLWSNNVLVDRRGRWTLLDWDELAPGDPAIDWAMLALTAATDRGFAAGLRRLGTVPDDATVARAAAYHHALVFSYAVDLIADWCEADALPAKAEAIRKQKEKRHRTWLNRYRRLAQ